MKKLLIVLVFIAFGCGHDKRAATVCTCQQLEKVADFVSKNVKDANNMSDEEMEDVVKELRHTGMLLYCDQRVMSFRGGKQYPDWEIEKLDSCEHYEFW